MNIAIIGTGLMGQALGERLLAKQQSLTLYNRTQDKTHLLQELGASVATSAQHAIDNSNISLLTILNGVHGVTDQVHDNLLEKHLVDENFKIIRDQGDNDIDVDFPNSR